MIRLSFLVLFALLTAGCAQLEIELEEPIIAEETAPNDICGDGDGIGGTGCPTTAVARQALLPF